MSSEIQNPFAMPTEVTAPRREVAPPPAAPRTPPAPPPAMRTMPNLMTEVTEAASRINSTTATQPSTDVTEPNAAATPTFAMPAASTSTAPAAPQPIPASSPSVPISAGTTPPPTLGHRPTTPPTAPNTRRSSNGSPTLEHIIRTAYDKGFSDIHLGVGEVPRFRNRGEIDTTDWPETDKPTFMSWLGEVLTEAEISQFEETLDFDGATQYEFARVRINIFDSLHGPAMVLRLIPLKILTMEQLNLPPVFKDVCHYHKGLILITGPTGSGKSKIGRAHV